MIIQKVIKGIGGIGPKEADQILSQGILCNWWRKVGSISPEESQKKLTDRNLDWHQNHYADPDPDQGGQPFHHNTPFISTTAGAVERDAINQRHVFHPAWQTAMEFATDGWSSDGYLFYCYLFVLGRPSIAHRNFSEEIRELNLYTAFSRWQPEGEITAKIEIPSVQIEKYEFYDKSNVSNALKNGRQPAPDRTAPNPLYKHPGEIINLREFLL